MLPILLVREQATARAHRAKNQLEALHHAETLLAERTRDVRPVDNEEGVVEDDPYFRYQLTLENFDLSTGRSEQEDEDWQQEQESMFGGNVPPDAGVIDEEDRDNPHLVRRFELHILWPDEEKDDVERELVLEGFLPRVWKEEVGSMLKKDQGFGSGTGNSR
jgi:hypothetical protein